VGCDLFTAERLLRKFLSRIAYFGLTESLRKSHAAAMIRLQDFKSTQQQTRSTFHLDSSRCIIVPSIVNLIFPKKGFRSAHIHAPKNQALIPRHSPRARLPPQVYGWAFGTRLKGNRRFETMPVTSMDLFLRSWLLLMSAFLAAGLKQT